MSLAERLALVQERVAAAAARSGRSASAVTIVGVCKTVSRPVIEAAYAAGLRHFGENRVQEAAAKFDANVPADLVLHLIGHLQTNKARPAVQLFQLIHSVDSIRLLDELERQAARQGRQLPVLLEVNISGEANKQGLAPQQVEAVAEHAAGLTQLQLRGLMTMAPLSDDMEATRPVFRRLRQLRDELAARHPAWSLVELSMGMTNDYPVAIEEGATLVRIGRAIFGG
jgi:hypothetical protein